RWVHSMTVYPMGILLIVYFMTISSFSAFTSVLALFMERSFGFNQKNMGLLFTVSGGTTVVVRGLMLGLLVKRFGEPTTVQIGIVALAFTFLAMPMLPNGT